MFSEEPNGYNKIEVNSYIQRMKTNYEAKLMEEKLKVLDTEKKLLDVKKERVEIENKEKNILTALNVIEKAKKFQEEGSKSFSKLIMDKVEILIKELNMKFPELRRDQNFEDIILEFTSMLQSYKNNLEKMSDITRPIYSDNDSMRMLLNKMQGYKRVHENPKEVHISATPKTLKEMPESESGFNFEEALNPTEDLEEIMKAFDFYNGEQAK